MYCTYSMPPSALITLRACALTTLRVHTVCAAGGAGERLAAGGPKVAPSSYLDPASLDMLGLASEPVAKPSGSYELPLIRGTFAAEVHTYSMCILLCAC